MDSLTHVALGATLGGAILGRQVGRRALVWGAVCATLPDLDILLRYTDPVASMTYHRSYTHALFVQALATPFIAWLVMQLHADTRAFAARWHGLVFLTLATHALLDCFTVYGTQILQPFSDYPVAWSTLFIIDPVYTLPLLIGALGAFVVLGDWRRARRWLVGGLVASSAYLGMTVVNKIHVDHVAAASLAAQGMAGTRFVSTPAPLSNLLWRIVARRHDAYLEGYYSLLDGEHRIVFRRSPSRDTLLVPIATSWPIERLRWFTKGFYRVMETGDLIRIGDLRMGMFDRLMFDFVVARQDGDQIEAIPPRRIGSRPPIGPALRWVWHRIWQPLGVPPALAGAARGTWGATPGAG